MRLCVLILIVVGPARLLPAEPHVFPHGCVAADHPLASEAGAEILRGGGNVVDAAVATAFALSVVRPDSCGLGGGGFMILWDARRQEAAAIDYRERAPAAAYREMYSDTRIPGDARPLSQRGGLAIAVPGDVAGLCFIHARYGSLDRQTVLAPAIRLATEGFALDQHAVTTQLEVLQDFADHPDYRERYAVLWRLYLNEGQPWTVGDRFFSPLGPVLRLIAQQGTSAFDSGEVAKAIVAEVREQGGILTVRDLRQNRPVVRQPLRGRTGDYDIITMPPPSSGGVALLQTLNIMSELERLGHVRPGAKPRPFHPEFIHMSVEAMKHAFADRAEWLGDSDFADVPVSRLTSNDYAAAIAVTIDRNRTQPLHAYGSAQPVEDHGTSHFSVLDADGNAVACTETINTQYGSYVVEPKYGIVLNNEMDDLAAVPGEPNAFGLVQSEANVVAAGKKPLSSMTPTILLQGGRAELVLGASGGPRIITATLLTLLNVIRFGMPVDEAVAAPRYHHQWLPETLFLEPPLFETRASPLRERGHQVTSRTGLGAVQAVRRTAQGVVGASDPRKGGWPAGH